MHPTLASLVRTTQIIVFALIAGMMLFAGVAYFVGPTTTPPPPPPPPLPAGAVAPAAGPFGNFDPLLLLLGAMIIGQLPVHAVMGMAINKQASQIAARMSGDPASRDLALSRLWFNSIILRAALAEGAGLLAGVILLLNGEMIALAGVAFAAVVMLMLIPSRGKLENWLQRVTNAAAMMPAREPGRR
ncbi:MAG: hypothetical protein KF699_14520 [Phycisphaeraceae bacterium]|nr:hypothetical protein [Phycisphaeraceae bacterium]